MKKNFPAKLKQAKKSLKKFLFKSPKTGIILGSGLNDFTAAVKGKEIPYEAIKGYPKASVKGHEGILKIGGGVAVCAGRFHYYEGLSMDTVVLPVFLLHAIGVKRLIITNAAGGINPNFKPGDLVLLKDHLNMLGANPLTGPNIDKLGPRFPDLSHTYGEKFRELAKNQKITPLQEGVYAAMAGPSYETPAEVAMLKNLGADMVGMSTVPEAIAASYLGMEVLGISCITNMAAGITGGALNHEEVIETGREAGKRLSALLLHLLAEFGHNSL